MLYEVITWRNYGGITRDLFLLGVPKLSIRKVVVGSRLSVSMTSAEVSVRATVESSRARADSMAAITRPGSGPAIYCEIVDKISVITSYSIHYTKLYEL